MILLYNRLLYKRFLLYLAIPGRDSDQVRSGIVIPLARVTMKRAVFKSWTYKSLNLNRVQSAAAGGLQQGSLEGVQCLSVIPRRAWVNKVGRLFVTHLFPNTVKTGFCRTDYRVRR